MSAVQNAIEHWSHVAPLLKAPTNEAEYDELTRALDEILDRIGEDEAHPLAHLASRMGDVISAYDERHRPMPASTGVEALRYLMQEHGLAQGALPEVGTQSVVSEILSGKRRLNVRQIVSLEARFGVPASTFIDRDAQEARSARRGKPDVVGKKVAARRRKRAARRPPSPHRKKSA